MTDALLWAMGEQSPLAVRGQSMQDVIFGGGKGVQARSSAEVEIVIDNADGAIDLPLGEISVLRRLDRSGEGEYRLNGARCRLVDVLDVLSDTGLCKEMHSVVSQGRVEGIVTSKPKDRRLLIEEAAGLGKHRKRRRRAQLKLDRTQDNLDRALDVEREARSRLRPLKRQAEAREHALQRELEELAAARQAAVARVEALATETERARTVLAEADSVAETARRARRAAEATAESARRDAAKVGAELSRANQFLRSHASAPGGARALADELQVGEGYELALSAALGSRMTAAMAADRPQAATLLDGVGRDGGARSCSAIRPAGRTAHRPPHLPLPARSRLPGCSAAPRARWRSPFGYWPGRGSSTRSTRCRRASPAWRSPATGAPGTARSAS